LDGDKVGRKKEVKGKEGNEKKRTQREEKGWDANGVQGAIKGKGAGSGGGKRLRHVKTVPNFSTVSMIQIRHLKMKIGRNSIILFKQIYLGLLC